LLIGGVCGLAAVLFHLLLDFLQDHIIYHAAAIPDWWHIPLLIAIPAVGGLIAGAGLYFYAPEARVSGIPQVKTAFYLDSGRIPARVIPAKMLLAAFNIGTGASLGREGPTVQICAAIASLLGRVFAISRRRLHSLLPVGAAAGLAAAFNTPIAAVTITLEEILGDSAAKPLGSIVIASGIAAVIAHVPSLPEHYYAYPVVNGGGRPVGLFTFNDLKRAMAAGQANQELSGIASRNLLHAYPDHTLDVALVKLGRKGVSQLPVVSRRDTTKLLGIITMHDIARALSKEDEKAEATLELEED
jgi:CBS domain-containing protein